LEVIKSLNEYLIPETQFRLATSRSSFQINHISGQLYKL